MTLSGIDISIYQGIVPEVAWRCLYLDGQRVAVIGSAHPQSNPYAETNFANAKAAGFEHLATYAALSPSIAGPDLIARAKSACGRFWPELRFAAVDCELDGITKEQISAALDTVAASGLRPVLYTGKWFTDSHPGLFDDFGEVPLWLAQYDGIADLAIAMIPPPWYK